MGTENSRIHREFRAISMQYETIRVKLNKGPNGFGIALGGGASKKTEFGETGVIITDVLQNSPGYGQLIVGDIILKINGIDMSKAEKPQATSLLKGAGKVDFLIRRRMPSFEPSGYGGQPASSTMMSAAQMQGNQMMDPAMMAQMIQQQQQQIMQQQNMMATNSMMGSMYDQNDPNGQMAKIMRNNIPEKHYSDSDENYHSRSRRSDSRDSTPERKHKKKSKKKYSSSERSSSRGSSLERDLKKIKIRDDYVTIPVKAHEPKRVILKKKQNESFGMKLGTRVFVQGLTNNGLAMREGLNNEDLILSIDGKDVDSMTIPEVQQMLINVDEVELEVKQVSGGTVTLPADVLSGLDGAKERRRAEKKQKVF